MELAITSLGMISSVGYGVAPACAAIRAGIVRPQPLHSFRVLVSQPVEEVPLTAHPIRDYTEGFALVGRWLRLASGAWADLLQYGNFPDRSHSDFWKRTGLVVAIPFPDEESLSGRKEQDLALLKSAYVLPFLKIANVPLRPEHTHLLWSGHTGALEGFCHAQRMLESTGIERVIVLAADSYLDESLLEELLSQRRLKTPAVPCGLMPGEAAACFLVEPQWGTRARRARPEAMVRAVTTARDERFSMAGPHTGTLLAQVIERALDMAGLTSPFLGDVHTDLNGENWRASHVAHAQLRLSQRLSPDIRIRASAHSLGEVGAASGAVAVCIACRSYQRGYALADTSLILMLSERGHFGAMLLERPRR
jgi:3-oxoacyl-[acyl-carrier-protein] synthase I